MKEKQVEKEERKDVKKKSLLKRMLIFFGIGTALVFGLLLMSATIVYLFVDFDENGEVLHHPGMVEEIKLESKEDANVRYLDETESILIEIFDGMSRFAIEGNKYKENENLISDRDWIQDMMDVLNDIIKHSNVLSEYKMPEGVTDELVEAHKGFKEMSNSLIKGSELYQEGMIKKDDELLNQSEELFELAAQQLKDAIDILEEG